MRSRQRGQVLAFFAVLLPIILLPLTAYAVDVAFVSTRAAGLQEATAQAAEAAAQQVDVARLRADSQMILDAPSARIAAIRTITDSEPGATVESVVVFGAVVTVESSETVTLPFNFLPAQAVKLYARAAARLVSGYDSPSSRLPLPVNSI